MSKWMLCEYDDDGEMTNHEFVSASDDSFWWCDSHNGLQTVWMKSEIYFRPSRIAMVVHPDEA